MNRTAEEFRAATGRAPWNDDLERANCPHAGEPGHTMCGWDEAVDAPRFMASPETGVSGLATDSQ